MGSHPRKILLVNKQIFYIPGFIFFSACKEIRLNDVIIKRIGPRKGQKEGDEKGYEKNRETVSFHNTASHAARKIKAPFSIFTKNLFSCQGEKYRKNLRAKYKILWTKNAQESIRQDSAPSY